MREPVRIASISTEYPSPWSPHRGLFIQRRLSALSRLADVTVLHTVPWFPVLRPWPGNRPPVLQNGMHLGSCIAGCFICPECSKAWIAAG